MKISGVMLGSDNPKGLGEFYTKVLGKPGWQQDDWYGFGESGSSLMVGAHSEIKGSAKEPQRIMMSFTVEDVKVEFERLKECGATVVAEPYQPDAANSPNMWLATLADPDGNYMQISLPWDA